jgi:hypothetical protein
MGGFGYSFGFTFAEQVSDGADIGEVRRLTLSGLLDQELDPVTLDYVDTDDGEWSDTNDSRSIVLCQLELEIGGSPFFPGDGTDLKRKLRTGDPITTADVEADTRRALGILEAAGIIGGVRVNGRDEHGKQLLDEGGRPAFETQWTDLATGSPVDDVYRPFGG